ncbi:MAG: hypothetical protein IKK97_00280 [Phascolarctobacterium sp.]|nr:hypothetical protein [Phascolarctobacterium sp.]
MAGMNRKMRRQMAKEKFVGSLSDEQRLNDMYRHASVAAYQNILAAAVLVVMNDFKLIQKKETRLNNFLGAINKRLDQLKSNEPIPEILELQEEMNKTLKKVGEPNAT